MTSSLPDRSPFPPDVRYTDEPPFYARIAWRQVGILAAIGLAVLGPIALAVVLAL